MEYQRTICLLNDSFPPQIDGVANAVVNYAGNIINSKYRPLVVTPSCPGANDNEFLFPVVRYPSVNFRQMASYVAGIPFSPGTAWRISNENVVLLHSHCPLISTLMARELRQIVDAPLVLTYHTKFDIDIANIIQNQKIQNACKRILVENISACDEVWAVSRGAGENLRTLGYEGKYTIMPNGVDLPKGRVPEVRIRQVTGAYDLPKDIPCYLFVGRIMRYKGIGLIIDALALLKAQGKDFRMVFVGDGDDRRELEQYAARQGLAKQCMFIGAVRDREVLRSWYCRGDLFLFPSTFDTNGLVVREAAACSLPSVLIRNSAAAEDVNDGENGFLIDESAQSLSECLLTLYGQESSLRKAGEKAGDSIYMTWNEAVKLALQQYEMVIERHQRGDYIRRKKPMEGVMKLNGELMEALGVLSSKLRERPW